MKINTTITAMKDGLCLFETDVTVYVLYEIEDGCVTWQVDQYTVSDMKNVWNDTRGVWERREREVAVPKNLELVLDEYLDRDAMLEQIEERLMDSGEIARFSDGSERADHHARVL